MKNTKQRIAIIQMTIVTNAFASMTETSYERKRWMGCKSCILAKQDLFTEFTSLAKLNFESSNTPRLQTTFVGERQFLKMLTGKESLCHLYLSVEPKTINYVLSGFI